MKNFFKLPINFELKDHPDQRILLVDFGDYPVDEYCLGLFLLKEHLIDNLVITDVYSTFKLSIKLDSGITSQEKPKVAFSKNDVKLTINGNELDYWIMFFLTYYRDGISNVDHIDVDAASMHGDITNAYIVFRVSNTSRPLSSDEARRRLGP